MGILFKTLKLLIISLTSVLSIGNNRVILAQTPEEMRDFVLQANREKYWPNPVCIPHGWSQNFTAELQQAKTSQELIDTGVSGLYKLEKITQKCTQLMDKNKDQLNTAPKKATCSKHCILRELGIVRNEWNQNFSLGDATTATAPIRELLSAKLYPDRANMSADLAAEIAVEYILRDFKESLTRPYYAGIIDNLTCLAAVDEAKYWETSYTRFIRDPMNLMSSCSVTEYQSFKFPSPRVSDLNGEKWRVVNKKEMETTNWQEWPDNRCFSNRYPARTGEIQESDFMLYKANQACRDQYNFSQMNQDFGEHSSETCTKVCILEHLYAVYPVQYEADQIFSKRGFHHPYRLNLTNQTYMYLLFPNWRDTEGEAQMVKLANIFFQGVEQAMRKNGFHEDSGGAECYQTERWSPVLRAAEGSLELACKECKECKNPAPSGKSGSGDGGSSELWPDFSSLKGWYDVAKRDAAHPLAASRGAGAVLLTQINTRCKDQVVSPSPPNQKCEKKCILEELGLITKTGTQGGAVDLTPFSTFMDGLRSVLTDKGGLATAKNMGKTLYGTLKDNKITGRVTDKGCRDAGRDGWDILFMLVEDAIRKAASGDIQSMVKPTG